MYIQRSTAGLVESGARAILGSILISGLTRETRHPGKSVIKSSMRSSNPGTTWENHNPPSTRRWRLHSLHNAEGGVKYARFGVGGVGDFGA